MTYLGFSDAHTRQADGGDSYQFENRNPVGEWCEDFVTVPLDSSYSPLKLARGLIGKTPLPVLNYTTPAMQEALDEIVGQIRFRHRAGRGLAFSRLSADFARRAQQTEAHLRLA